MRELPTAFSSSCMPTTEYKAHMGYRRSFSASKCQRSVLVQSLDMFTSLQHIQNHLRRFST